MIGMTGVATVMDKDIYDRLYHLSKDAKDLIIKLLDRVFTIEELASSNFHGGEVFSPVRVTKAALRKHATFRALVAQAELQYPGETTCAGFGVDLRDSVNNKCRKATFKLRHAL